MEMDRFGDFVIEVVARLKLHSLLSSFPTALFSPLPLPSCLSFPLFSLTS